MKTIPKILIVGSTGELGSMFLRYCNKNKININATTGFKNKKKLYQQKNKFKIKNVFLLSDKKDKNSFNKFLANNKIDIIYFLDFGCESILYADIFLKNNKNSIIAIANKEMIIAGGKLLINKIINSKNKLIPLDSEHFSIANFNLKNEYIKKIYITASGGPFYYKKNINLNNVNLLKVLSHPKWKMGVNNSIDSSNFVNKFLEMYELSFIYNIDLKKIDFLVTSEAYIHSVIINNDNTININCFDNNMLITLIKPLLIFYPHLTIPLHDNFLKLNKLKLEKFKDNRFKISKFSKDLKKLCHSEQISFMILNNIAQKKYLKSEIKYNSIINYIMSNLKKIKTKKEFNSFNDTIKFVNDIKQKYES